MKRKNVLAVITVAIMALAGYLGYVSSHNEELSDIQLENIEALAFGEFVVGEGWECYEKVYDDVDNSMFFTVTRCGDCAVTSAVYVNGFNYCSLSGIYGR